MIIIRVRLIYALTVVLGAGLCAACGTTQRWGFQESFSCHRSDLTDTWIKIETPSDHAAFAGVGGVDCSHDDPLFDLSATLGYAVEGPSLPDWLDLTYVPFEKSIAAKSTDYSAAEFNELLHGPGVTQRVYVRRQIPQRIVEQVRAAARQRQYGAIPKRLLHVYIVLMADGIKLTWALESGGGPPLEYGGYVPQQLSARTLKWLESGNSRYIPPDPSP